MDYFAGLDISMDETHICVVDRDGAVAYEGKSALASRNLQSHQTTHAPRPACSLRPRARARRLLADAREMPEIAESEELLWPLSRGR
jgi:hypothetical protein